MKNPILTITLVLAFVLPMLTVLTQARPQGWYVVLHPDGVAMKSEHGANGPRGRLKCHVPHRAIVHRDNNDTSVDRQGWIYVRWKIEGGFEWDYKDKRGKWCPDWNRHGWIEKSRVKYCGQRKVNDPVKDCNMLQPGWHLLTVTNTGNWGNEVPVFESTSAFFKGRGKMRSGDTKNFEGVKCVLRAGAKVRAKTVKDWGVSEVRTVTRRSDRYTCVGSGYMDRGLLRY